MHKSLQPTRYVSIAFLPLLKRIASVRGDEKREGNKLEKTKVVYIS